MKGIMIFLFNIFTIKKLLFIKKKISHFSRQTFQNLALGKKILGMTSELFEILNKGQQMGWKKSEWDLDGFVKKTE